MTANQNTWLLAAACLLLAAAIFALDLRLPLGVAGGVAYVAVVLISLWSPRRRLTLSVAAAVSALTVAGFVWSPSGGVPWMVLSNRALALFVIWATALLGLQARRSYAARIESEVLDAFFDDAPAGLAIFDSELRYRKINSGLARINGLAAEEHIGKTPGEVLGALGALCESMLRAVLETGKPVLNVETSGNLANRPEMINHFISSSFPIASTDGKPTAIASIVVEVTERKRAEEALRVSERELQELNKHLEQRVGERTQALQQREDELSDFFENATVGLHCLGPDGVILLANRAELDLLGYAREDYVGRHIADFHVDQDAIETLLARLSEHEAIQDYEARLRCKDGSIKDVLITSSVLERNGEFIHTRCFTRDITERKHLENQLRAAAHAGVLAEDRERHELARDLHDDLGQLLALSSMKLGALRTTAEAHELVPQLRELKKLIDEAHERTTSLTFQLSPPVLHDLGIVGAAEWLSEELQRRYNLHTAIEDDGLPKPLDEGRRVFLFRALRELLINVAKHAGADRARARFWREGEALFMVVEDAGNGFDSSATRGGYGLLSIREHLKALGGDMSIESVPGDGTKVLLTTPLASEPPEGEAGSV